MAGGKSYYLENKYIDFLFRGQPFPGGVGTGPATIYVALYTVAPDASGGGTEVSTAGSGYARVPVASSLVNWAGTQIAGSTSISTGTSGQTSNNLSIVFGTPTSNWGTITHFGLFDAATSGHLLYWGPLDVSEVVLNGFAAPSFSPGALKVTES